MSRELDACAYAAEFPAQALLRLRVNLQSEPVAVLEGRVPQQVICALNQKARQRGAALGMTRLEADGIAGLRLLVRSMEEEAAARTVFLECASQFSPRIEETSKGTVCAFVLDILGMERLFGPPGRLAERLRTALAEAGFRASIAVSANYHAARMSAANGRNIMVIPEGEEVNALARLPIAALGLAGEHEETFVLWGIMSPRPAAATSAWSNAASSIQTGSRAASSLGSPRSAASSSESPSSSRSAATGGRAR